MFLSGEGFEISSVWALCQNVQKFLRRCATDRNFVEDQTGYRKIGCLPVIEGETLVGILSEAGNLI